MRNKTKGYIQFLRFIKQVIRIWEGEKPLSVRDITKPHVVELLKLLPFFLRTVGATGVPPDI